jgi:hypothetical protein
MTTASFIKLSPRRTSSDLRTSMETARLPAVPALASLHPMRRLRTWMAGVALLAVTAAALVVASVPMGRLISPFGALLALGVLLLGVAIQLLVPQTRPERERWRPSLDHTRQTPHARDQPDGHRTWPRKS